MRGAFVRALVEVAAHDDRVVLLTGDLGFMALEPFSCAYPDRFINVGVAEQNMIGVACGLADAGFLPFCYSIATFASMRGYEFIRNAAAIQHAPIRIVGVGGGFEYGPAGASHHSLEDVGLMRVQPNIAVIAPADYLQTLSAVRATWDLPGPIYYRIGKDDRREVPGLDGRFELGRIELIGSGDDLLFLASGAIATEAAAAVEKLAASGVRCTLGVVSTLNPSPVDELKGLLGKFPLAITVESHQVTGGLGSLVCEVAAENGIGCKIVRRGVSSPSSGVTGSETFLTRRHGLDSDSLFAAAMEAHAHRFV